jgi:hypothetical protein
MILYLFLVVVGDRKGRSFYSDRSISEILRLRSEKLNQAREELIFEGLISYRRPYWEVRNLPQGRGYGRDDKANHTLSSGCPETELLPDSRADRDFAKACLVHISRILSAEEKKEALSSGSLPCSDRGVVQRVSYLKSPTGLRVVKGEGDKD